MWTGNRQLGGAALRLLLITDLIDTNGARARRSVLPLAFAGRSLREASLHPALPAAGACHPDADAAAIRAAFDQKGELSAAIELRRRFPGITDDAKARACARTIAGWMPLTGLRRPVTRLRPRKGS